MGITIALAGNPNSGKTTLFNALTGSNQFVGNWPGVTVEKKEGKLKSDKDIKIADLPGIYSLSPYTLEEVVARNYLLQEHPDAILDIVDGTNLERNLYLTTQLCELGIPVVVAVNMTDIVTKNGDKIYIEKLEKEIGCKVVEISALKGTGITEAADAAIQAAKSKVPMKPQHKFGDAVENVLTHIESELLSEIPEVQKRWYAVKIFERDEKILEQLNIPGEKMEPIEAEIQAVETELDDDTESIITSERYTYIASIIKACYKKKKAGELSVSDKIDKIVTNRWLGLPIFAVVMFIVYFVSVTTIGSLLTDWVNDVFIGEWCQGGASWLLEQIHCAEWLEGLIVYGIVAGVGAVVGFVPQVLVLFIFLAFLESCGYMARVAFVMDRIFRKFGFSGKSFIPMLIGSGCGVPAIMASRTIENEHDRRMTIMTTTFIPCGAKLPIIALIAGALFNGSAWVSVSAYFIGVAAIIVSGVMLKKTKPFRGDPAPFVMELPAYHLPTVGNVLRSMWERGWSFIKKAGTLILVSTIVLWFLMSFGFEEGFCMVEDINNSILAYIGKGIAWLFTPNGWGNWKAAVGAISGLLAKENLVATFGMIYGIEEAAEDGSDFWAAFANEFTALSGYSFMVFNLLCAPCFAAMGAIKREMNSGKWTAFAIIYQCVFAYVVSLCIYQIGAIFSSNDSVNVVGLIVAIVLVAFILFMLFRPYPKDNRLKTPIKT